MPSSDQRAFATTSWSLIVNAGGSGADARQALEQLCQMYWYPLYAFLRRDHPREDAEDLTQAFFAHLLERDRLGIADPVRGRFRTFLLKSLQNFAIGQWRKETAKKRGGDTVIRGLDFQGADQRFHREPADSRTPEREYDRVWALTLLDETLSGLEREYEASGKAELFASLKDRLVDDTSESLADVAERLGMSLSAIKIAAHRLRQRYRDRLRHLVLQTVEHVGQVDEELTILLAALG
jgi:RNA polymerase sigma-70 factor (ECF subfamily)